jgi:hypothetical protein
MMGCLRMPNVMNAMRGATARQAISAGRDCPSTLHLGKKWLNSRVPCDKRRCDRFPRLSPRAPQSSVADAITPNGALALDAEEDTR